MMRSDDILQFLSTQFHFQGMDLCKAIEITSIQDAPKMGPDILIVG